MKKTVQKTIIYFSKNIFTIIGLILIWRGIWYALDYLDKIFFSQQYFLVALIEIALGLLIIYLPDHDLKEIEKL